MQRPARLPERPRLPRLPGMSGLWKRQTIQRAQKSK